MRQIAVERRANSDMLPVGGRRSNEQPDRMNASLAGDITLIENTIEWAVGLGGGFAGYRAIFHPYIKRLKKKDGVEKRALGYLFELKLHEKTWRENGARFPDERCGEFVKELNELRADSKEAMQHAIGIIDAEDTLTHVIRGCDMLIERVEDMLQLRKKLRDIYPRNHWLSRVEPMPSKNFDESSAYATSRKKA